MSAVSCFDALRKALGADLDFHGTDGKYASHGWHPFPAKFPPQLPQFFIEHLSDVEDVVLDPMLGSGTTLVEAMRLGRRVRRKSVGFDLAGIGVRRLDRDKRMMPARWGTKRHSQIEERMHEEYVIGLVKS